MISVVLGAVVEKDAAAQSVELALADDSGIVQGDEEDEEDDIGSEAAGMQHVSLVNFSIKLHNMHNKSTPLSSFV